MIGYLRLEILRVLRNQRYLFLSLALPVGFYLLFSSLFGTQRVQGMAQPVELMVAMGVYGAVGASLMATGPRVATERTTGWLRQLRATPLRARKVVGAKVAAAMALGLPAAILVGLTAALTHHVRLTPVEWAGYLALTTLGTTPFALLGLLVGYLSDEDTASSLTSGVYLAMSALGGLWMPLTFLPKTLQTIGRLLPTNRLADLSWRVVSGGGPSAASVAVLAAWSAVFGLAAAASYRVSTRRA